MEQYYFFINKIKVMMVIFKKVMKNFYYSNLLVYISFIKVFSRVNL
jgi:hypothetical protein